MYIIFYYLILYYIILYHIILYYILLYYIVLYYIICVVFILYIYIPIKMHIHIRATAGIKTLVNWSSSWSSSVNPITNCQKARGLSWKEGPG